MGVSTEIASWPALLAHLHATLAPGASAERFSYDRDGTRCELGIAKVLAPPGPPWLCLMVWLGPVEKFVLRAALVANAELPIGALALLDKHIVLRQTLPLEGLLVAQLEQAIRGLAEVGLELEAAVAQAESPYAYVVR
jgi:hypothetical protein